jgi:hypothetical protein
VPATPANPPALLQSRFRSSSLHAVNTGNGCTNPPLAAQFYPIFSTARNLSVGVGGGNGAAASEDNGHAKCVWQFGGSHIVGTISTFGGSASAEYGSLIPLVYARPAGPVTRFNDYRQVLNSNPCSERFDK